MSLKTNFMQFNDIIIIGDKTMKQLLKKPQIEFAFNYFKLKFI